MNRITPIILLMTLVVPCYSQDSDYIVYFDPFYNEKIILSPSEQIVYNGPYGDMVDFCENSEEFLCVNHPAFWFGIQKDISKLKEGSSWVVGDYYYEIKGIEDNYLVGKEVSNVYIIYSKLNCKKDNPKNAARYAYSVEKGVLAAEFFEHKAYGMLILKSEIGFGAISRGNQ